MADLTGNTYIALLVGVSAAVTWALRALPFAALAPMRNSTVVRYLSVHMPVGVMVMLTIYTLRAAAKAGGLDVAWLAVGVVRSRLRFRERENDDAKVELGVVRVTLGALGCVSR